MRCNPNSIETQNRVKPFVMETNIFHSKPLLKAILSPGWSRVHDLSHSPEAKVPYITLKQATVSRISEDVIRHLSATTRCDGDT